MENKKTKNIYKLALKKTKKFTYKKAIKKHMFCLTYVYFFVFGINMLIPSKTITIKAIIKAIPNTIAKT